MRGTNKDLRRIVEILRLIAETPNYRESPQPGDLPGRYDFWFDGGAAEVDEGMTEFQFADGSKASKEAMPWISVYIELASGAKYELSDLEDPNR